jgi:mycothiol synthase
MDTDVRHLRIPEGFRVRRPTAADAGAVAELKRAAEIDRHGDSDVTVENVREEWALPRLVLGRDAWLVEDEAGIAVGYAFCWVEAPPGDIFVELTVDPGRRGRGLSSVLLDLGERRAADVFRAAAPAHDGSLGTWAHEGDDGRRRLFERRGFRHIRTFLRLGRDLGPEVEEPAWPPGVSVAGFRKDRDEAPVHAAGEEAFRDHFRPEEMDLDEWIEFRFSREGFDLGLWWVAWDGEEVAGSVIACETPLGGYVDELFVRRPWRGRGLGRALLLQACGELRRRGRLLAYLGVDSENPTGAMHLYSSAGFHALRRPILFYEKTLTGGAET